jgi:hypothetical protein
MGLLNRILLGAVAFAAVTAHAHVAVEPKSAPVNSYTRLTFRVGHGCDAAATIALTVKFPDDLKTVRPQPKPGWTVEMKKEPVVEVTWRGRLDADYFDDFGALVHLPSTPGIRRFAIKQECEGKSMEWTPSLDVVK